MIQSSKSCDLVFIPYQGSTEEKHRHLPACCCLTSCSILHLCRFAFFFLKSMNNTDVFFPCAHTGNNYTPISAVSSVCYIQQKPYWNQQASEDAAILEDCSLWSNTLHFYGLLLILCFFPVSLEQVPRRNIKLENCVTLQHFNHNSV